MDYFEGYEDLNVHKTMLEDTIRNSAYQKAIFDNKDKFNGKVVLDVGAGTGILSVFCAQAGASKVYAVEASNVFKLAQEILKENNVDHIVEVVHSKVENLKLHGNEKVDIIISEWMGHYLLHEGMVDSLIFARDNFLRPEGLLFPENVTLFSSPCSIPSFNESWANVNGVSMKSFGKQLKEAAMKEPLLIQVSPDDVLSEPETVLWLNLHEVTLEDLESIKFRHVATALKDGRYQGICLWFTCTFPYYSTEPVILSTGPDDPKTHWLQTVISLPIDVDIEKGTPLAYDLVLKRSNLSLRKYTIEVTMLDPEDVEHPLYCGCHMTKCILARAVLEKYEHGDFAMS